VADNSKLWPGVIVTPINDEIRQAVKLDAKVKGLYVVEVITKSPAAVMGLQRGDIIVGVNGENAKTLPDFFRLLNDKAKKDIWFEVQRGDTTLETMRYKRP
jgi:S1-C subfamily serine protease